MTEIGELPLDPVNLELRTQIPMVIPQEIKNLRHSNQLPIGDIAYFDTSETDILRMVNPETWKPITKKGIETRYSVDQNMGRRFAGIIVHTPPRNPDDNNFEILRKLSLLLKRSAKRDEGIITEQNLGTLYIVEGLGEDMRVGWRENQMRELGLVVDRLKGEKAVVVTQDYIITHGRRPKQRSAVDLTTGRVSGHKFKDYTDDIERRAKEEGLVADTTMLQKEASQTKFVLRTISNLREGGNVTYKGEDEDGHNVVYSTDRHGEVSSTPNSSKLKGTEIGPKGKDRIYKQIAEAVVNPEKFIPSGLKCFKYHESGQVNDLLLKYESVRQPDGTFEGRIFRFCLTHGSRFWTKAPSHEEAIDIIQKSKKA